MADRTWNRVQPRLYDEWQLSKYARLILAHIIALSPNQYGIYDPSPYGRVVEWWQGLLSPQEFDEAWQSLIAAGKIVEFRNRDCLWLVKKFKHEQNLNYSPNQRKGIENFFANYPEVMESFSQLYSIPMPTPSEPHANPMPTPCEGDRKGVEVTEPEPEPEKEITAPVGTGADMPPVGEKSSPKIPPKPTPPQKPAEPVPYSPEYLEFAIQMDADVLRMKDQGWPIGRAWRRQPSQMALSLHLSGVNLDEAKNAWRWALTDAYWQGKLVEQMSFQKQPNRWVTLVNAYRSRRNATVSATGPTGEKLRTSAQVQADLAARQARRSETAALALEKQP